MILCSWSNSWSPLFRLPCRQRGMLIVLSYAQGLHNAEPIYPNPITSPLTTFLTLSIHHQLLVTSTSILRYTQYTSPMTLRYRRASTLREPKRRWHRSQAGLPKDSPPPAPGQVHQETQSNKHQRTTEARLRTTSTKANPNRDNLEQATTWNLEQLGTTWNHHWNKRIIEMNTNR